jgi:DNA polymerase III subunit gamma/tau
VFILATTDAHKLPETIISRTQRFTFRPYPLEQVAGHLKTLAQKEKIDIDDEALRLIAAHGEGSFRDSISLLDQTRGYGGKVDADYIRQLIGVPPLESIHELADALSAHDSHGAIAIMNRLHEQGFQAAQIARQLGQVWREQILEAGHASPMDFQLLQKLLDVPAAQNPDRYFEIVLLEFTLAESPTAAVAAPKPAIHAAKPAAKPESPKPAEPAKEKITKPKAEPQAAGQPAEAPAPPQKTAATKATKTPSAKLDETVWPQILAALKKEYNTLYGIVRMSQPDFHGGELELGFSFAFHQKQVSQAKNQKIIADIVRQVTGQEVAISCKLVKDKPKAVPAAAELAEAAHAVQPDTQPTAEKPDIASISNIFGGAELLES